MNRSHIAVIPRAWVDRIPSATAYAWIVTAAQACALLPGGRLLAYPFARVEVVTS